VTLVIASCKERTNLSVSVSRDLLPETADRIESQICGEIRAFRGLCGSSFPSHTPNSQNHPKLTLVKIVNTLIIINRTFILYSRTYHSFQRNIPMTDTHNPDEHHPVFISVPNRNLQRMASLALGCRQTEPRFF